MNTVQSAYNALNAHTAAADAVRDMEASIRRIREIRAQRFQSAERDLLSRARAESAEALAQLDKRHNQDIRWHT